MTIELVNVTKKVRLGAIRFTYKDLNIRVEENTRVAFLGQKAAGLEAVVNLICCADAPDSGIVRRSHSISWAIPGSTFLHKHHSIAANARFVARLYEANEREFLVKVSDMAKLGEFANVRADLCPKEVLSRFVFSTGMCLPFDHYILTNVTAGTKEDRPHFEEVVAEAGQRAGLLLVTHDVKSAQKFCDQAYVFSDGGATHFDNMEAAAEFYGSLAAEGDDGESFFDADEELQELASMDF